MVEWTERGLDLAGRSSAAGWAGPRLNNLGWAYFEAGECEPALDAFRRALAARERDGGNPGEIPFARYCVAKALRALGRPRTPQPSSRRSPRGRSRTASRIRGSTRSRQRPYAAFSREPTQQTVLAARSSCSNRATGAACACSNSRAPAATDRV
jgi:hypothetical protein